MNVYLIAPRSELLRVVGAAELLRGTVTVCSTWHERFMRQTLGEARLPTTERLRILAENLDELRSADVGLVLSREGQGVEAYVEIGRMLQRRRRLVWSVQYGGRALSLVDARVHVVETDMQAIEAVTAIAERRMA